MALTFSTTIEGVCASAHRDSDVDILTVEFGVQRQIDLIPGGSEIPVTAENRHECEQNFDRLWYSCQ